MPEGVTGTRSSLLVIGAVAHSRYNPHAFRIAMALGPGVRLGPYEIQAAIGAGGMGEVYKATDTRLDRIVAIKVLPEHVASDPDLKQRFEREAKTLAALSHPHICPVFDVGSQNGIDFLVMEYLEGQTLEQRLKKGALPLDQALHIGIQIADALAAAHRTGIIHRDLKPGNIMLAKSGARLLDFGLAKVVAPTVVSSLSMLPTTLPNLTAEGTILGTLQYMAPEQLEGHEADARTDIFAFGGVLYEMVTGKRAFEGKSQASLIGAILHDTPPQISSVQSAAPTHLGVNVARCLAKDPDDRWQSAADLVFALKTLLHTGPTSTVPSTIPRRRPTLASMGLVSAAMLLLLTAPLAVRHLRETSPDTAPVLSSILAPEGATFDFTNGTGLPALSPDGRRIVFGARGADGKPQLWVRSLEGFAAQSLAGTDNATFPFWSPDGRTIAFFADGKLKKIDAGGGPVITLADAPNGRGGSWSRDGLIVFAPASTPGFQRISSAGGAASAVPGEQGSAPWFLPDGRHFLYQGQAGTVAGFVVEPVRLSADMPIRVRSLDGTVDKPIGRGSNALYTHGHLVFLFQGTLMAQPFDIERLETTGDAVPLAEDVQTVLGSGRMGVFSASSGGMLIYRQAAGQARRLTWFDRAGKAIDTLESDPDLNGGPELSPDGKRVAIDRTVNGNRDVWLMDVTRGGMTRFTFEGHAGIWPVWSGDGSSIVFGSEMTNGASLYVKPASGAGAAQVLLESPTSKVPSGWSPDSRFLLYSDIDA